MDRKYLDNLRVSYMDKGRCSRVDQPINVRVRLSPTVLISSLRVGGFEANIAGQDALPDTTAMFSSAQPNVCGRSRVPTRRLRISADPRPETRIARNCEPKQSAGQWLSARPQDFAIGEKGTHREGEEWRPLLAQCLVPALRTQND